jgi:glycosyltransferase involved in cell wall biosynthesis
VNILMLTQVLPYPPDSGPKVKTWNVIKYLALHHDVTLVSFVRGEQAAEVAHLRQVCKAVHTVEMRRSAWRDGLALLDSLLRGEPWVISRDRRAAMFRLVCELAAREDFDVVQADQLNMAPYAQIARGRLRVVDEHNALWLLYQRMAATSAPGLKKLLFSRDWRLLRGYEGQICRRFDGVLAVSEEDRHALQEVAGTAVDIQVVPIAVDTDEVVPVERKPDARRIVHVGTMFWPPNVDGILWFAHEVLPLVRAIFPEVGFDVIGARPPAEVMALAESDAAIRVPGYVEDVSAYLAQAGAMIVPLRAGGGMRVKILNALSQGLPIVTTTIGCEGIAVEHGRHLLIADTPQAFAEAVTLLLQDRALGEELGRNGRTLIQEKYDYRQVCAQLEQVYAARKKGGGIIHG